MRPQKNQTPRKPTLHTVQRRFQYWRKVRKKHAPLPDKLWRAAATLCAEYPAHQVAAALDLSQAALNRRVKDAKRVGRKFGIPAISGTGALRRGGERSPNRFIEFAAEGPTGPGVIEVNDPCGWSIIFRGTRVGELLPAAQRIWDARG